MTATGVSHSPSESSTNDQQPDVVEVNEDAKQDAEAKDGKEQSASLSDYFVCPRSLSTILSHLLTIYLHITENPFLSDHQRSHGVDSSPHMFNGIRCGRLKSSMSFRDRNILITRSAIAYYEYRFWSVGR